MNKKRLFAVLSAAILALSLVSCHHVQEASKVPPSQDVVVLYVNDVHCAIDANIGYAGLAALRKESFAKTPFVTTVDVGDAVQGDVLGTISKGSYIINLMNETGFDFAVIGNHEFDYGMQRLSELIKNSKAKYLCSNIKYTGKKTSALADTVPYEIVNYGDTKIAYIGVSTPYSIKSSTPTYFMEDDKFVYDFYSGNNGKNLSAQVQKTVNEAKKAGAQYVIALTHLGIDANTAEEIMYNSITLIQNTVGIDAVLDGHSHSVIKGDVIKNKNGEDVILSSTGTKFQNVGRLVLNTEGKLSTELISTYEPKEEKVAAAVEKIKADCKEELNKVVATSEIDLSISDENGVRLVRSRETALSNLCADAYRYMAKADIALVNGGGVRANIKKGNVTYGNIISVHPFGNMLTCVKATGQQILDSLEHTSQSTAAEYVKDGKAFGEFGGFLACSGLKYTIDTSIPTPVKKDDKGIFQGIEGARRVKDVQVLKNGKWEPINPAGTYTVASHDYLLKSGGDGNTLFMKDEILIDSAMLDNQVLINYITEALHGKITAENAKIEGRITIK